MSPRLKKAINVVLCVFYLSVLGVSADSIWPKPLNQTTSSRVLYLDIEKFHFKCIGSDSLILERAFERYEDIIFRTPAHVPASERSIERVGVAEQGIHRLKVYVASNDQSLNLQTDESYALIVSAPTSTLEANSVYGALRGLETFSQLIERVDVGDWDSLAESRSTAQEVVGETAPGLMLSSVRRRLLQDPSLQLAAHAQLSELPKGKDGQISRWDTGEDTEEDSGEDAQQGLLVAVDEDAGDSDSDDERLDSLDRKHKDKHKKQKHKKHKHKKHHKERPRHSMMYTVNATAIWDTPRFAHRGLLLDSSRHFLPLDVIKENLDAMASVKMNVLHWHIVDDQSFPYQSNALPRLSQFGAFSAAHIYSPGDVAEVVGYARDRGIRVIPEFDTPGHTASWGKGYPELLTDCYDAQERPTGVKGPINPARNETYALLWKLLREAAALFPDSYIHLGGDEVPFDCWQSSPEIKAFMDQQGLTSVADLETYFEGRVLGLARQAGRNYIVWQEILDNGVQIERDTVVHVWKWWAVAEGQGGLHGARPRVCELSKGCRPDEAGPLAAGPPAWAAELAKATSKGYKALLSSPWYLNLGMFADEAWAIYYKVEPLEFDATPEQSKLVIGGEACMWGEWVDSSNVVQETWPRAAAIAERLWSAQAVNDVDEARPRLKEHRCRMLARGIAASPGTGPGFCPTDSQDL